MFKSMKRIIQWAGKYKGRLYLGSVFSFFSSLSTAIPTMAAAYALDKTIAAYWTGSTIESALIWQTLWIIVGSIALNFLLSYLRAVLQESIGYEVAAGQRIHLGDVLKRVPLGYFSKNSVGDILTGVTTELWRYRRLRPVRLMVISRPCRKPNQCLPRPERPLPPMSATRPLKRSSSSCGVRLSRRYDGKSLQEIPLTM